MQGTGLAFTEEAVVDPPFAVEGIVPEDTCSDGMPEIFVLGPSPDIPDEDFNADLFWVVGDMAADFAAGPVHENLVWCDGSDTCPNCAFDIEDCGDEPGCDPNPPPGATVLECKEAARCELRICR